MTGDRELPDDDALPEGLAELLRAEQQAPGPSAGSHDRVLQRLEQTLALPPPDGGGDGGGGGGGGGGGAGGVSAAAGGALAASGGGKAGLMAAVALAFAGGAGAGALGHAKLAPPPPPVVEVRTVVSVQRVVEPAAVPPPSPSPVALPSASASPSPTPRARPSTAPQDPTARDRALADENALIARAQAALSRGNDAQAQAALREHATRFPQGQLSEERRLLEQHTRTLEKSR